MTIYTVSSLVLFLENDWRLTLPLLLWLALYIGTLAFFVPRVRRAATATAEARSTLVGRIVDSYTNMATVKLFAHADAEDAYAREAIAAHNRTFIAQQRLVVLEKHLVDLKDVIAANIDEVLDDHIKQLAARQREAGLPQQVTRLPWGQAQGYGQRDHRFLAGHIALAGADL